MQTVGGCFIQERGEITTQGRVTYTEDHRSFYLFLKFPEVLVAHSKIDSKVPSAAVHLVLRVTSRNQTALSPSSSAVQPAVRGYSGIYYTGCRNKTSHLSPCIMSMEIFVFLLGSRPYLKWPGCLGRHAILSRAPCGSLTLNDLPYDLRRVFVSISWRLATVPLQ